MFDDERDRDLEADISWLEVLAAVGLLAVCLWGVSYIVLKLIGLL